MNGLSIEGSLWIATSSESILSKLIICSDISSAISGHQASCELIKSRDWHWGGFNSIDAKYNE